MIRTSDRATNPINTHSGNGKAKPEPLIALPASRLLADFPELKAPVIDGLLRETELLNLISAAKAGKTYLAINLAIAVATGQMWLRTFPVQMGRVLYVDAELHPATMSRRLAAICSAMGLMSDSIADRLDVLHLRGRLRNLIELRSFFTSIKPGHYKLILLDALYRFLPPDCDENSNSDMARCFNLIDCYAEHTRSAFVIVHHASKGIQGHKSIVDVGAGASAQARATDSHLILRAHETDGAIVLDCAARSWPPINSTCLRWQYPLWVPAPDLDPTALKVDAPRRRKPQPEPAEPAAEPWTANRFVREFVTETPQARQTIVARAKEQGLSKRRCDELLALAEADGMAFRWTGRRYNEPVRLATIPQQVIENGGNK